MTAAAKKSVMDDAEVDRRLEAGLMRHEAGDLPAAIALFEQALAIDPDNATGLYLLGLARFAAGEAESAQQLLERLVSVRGHRAEAHLALANIRHWREDRAGAILAYRAALGIDASNLSALVGLSRALAEHGEAAEALSPAERAVALAPGEADAHVARAAALRGLQRIADAADAFGRAAALAPNLAAAHVGQALALCDLGEAASAKACAERALAIDADLCDAWLALGIAERGLHDPSAAEAALERAVALDPNRVVAHLNLGLALIELERARPARDRLMRVLELDPANAKAHANLSSLYYLAARPALAKAHAERALAIDPDLMSAHQNLAALLADERRPEEARAHRNRAYAERNLIVTHAAEPKARVLILSTTESGNIPERHLIPPADYTRLLWFIEYASERQMAELPTYDIAFNAIGDEDLAGPTAANSRRFAEVCPVRLLNPPDRISRTRRDLMAELLGGVGGALVPRSERLAAEDLAEGPTQAASRLGIDAPWLIRPVGSHGGKGLLRVDEHDGAPALPSAAWYYLTAFQDFRSPDGFWRKYRAIFVDRAPLPYHLAISRDWMVHYESAGMEGDRQRLAEEARYLEDPAAALGADAWKAIAAIGRALDLDYAGVDFSLTPDGRVLVFEANATMLVHPETPDGPLAHKNPYVRRILDAFQAMLARP